MVCVSSVSRAKRTIAAALGVAFVDYTAGDVVAQVHDLAPHGVDGVVDTVGGESLRTLAPLAGDPRKVVSVTDPSVIESGGEMVRRQLGRPELERVAALMIEGRLDPHVTTIYPLVRAAEALAVVEGGHALGKVVLDLRAPTS